MSGQRDREGGEPKPPGRLGGDGTIAPGKKTRTERFTKQEQPKGVVQAKADGEGVGAGSHRGRIQVQGGGLELSRPWRTGQQGNAVEPA